MLRALQHPRVASEDLRAGVTGQAFKGRIDVLDGAGVVGDDDAVANRLQGRVQTQLLQLLQPLPISDVQERHHDARQFACGAELGQGVDQHPPEIPGAGPIDAIHAVPQRLSRAQDLIHRILVHGQRRFVLPHERPRGVVIRLARHLGGRDAQQFGGPVVGQQDAGVLGMDHDADVQVRDQLTITEFTLPQVLLRGVVLGHLLLQSRVGHRQRVCPVADGAFQHLMRSLEVPFGGAASGDDRRERQPGQRVHVHEHLEVEQRPLPGLKSERPQTGRRPCDDRGREKRGGQRDDGEFEPQAGPHQEDQGDVEEMLSDRLREPASENGLAGEHHQGQQGRQFGPAGVPPHSRPGFRAGQHQRGHDHESRDVAQPPGGPIRRELGPRRVAAQDQGRPANGGSDDRRHPGRGREQERLFHALEGRVGPRDHPAVQPGPHQRFEGVSGRDRGRGCEGHRRRAVGQKRAQPDSRPNACPGQQDGRQRHAGGRPQGGGVSRRNGEPQPDDCHRHVGRCQQRNPAEVAD